jgi:IclR family pca regulon transcriptional regulator
MDLGEGMEKEAKDKREELLDSLSKGLFLLQLFASGGASLTIQEVAEKLDVTRAAARRLLHTLLHHGYVMQEGKAFWVTPKVIELGYAYFAAMDLPTLARKPMRLLAEQLNETCSLAVLDGSAIVLIAREEPQQMVRLDMTVGRRMPAYAHSLGRALLAFLDTDRWEAYLANTEWKKLTQFTTCTRSGLERKLAQVRADDYSLLISEMVDGLAGLSVPLRERDGHVIASLGVSMVLGSRTEKQIIRQCLPALRETAGKIEALLHAMGK